MHEIITSEAWSLLNNYFGEQLFTEADITYIEQNDPYDGTLIGYNKNVNAILYDSHKFFFLKLFHLRSLLGHPLRIIHVDRHWDSLTTEISTFRLNSGLENLSECLKFVDIFLHEGNFLRAACYENLIEEIVFVVPETNKLNIETNLKLFEFYPRLKVSHLFDLCELNNLETLPYVLDLDMDYFFDRYGNKTLCDKVLINLLSRQWRSIGVALSPRHCGGGLEIPLDMFNRCSKLLKNRKS